MREEVDEHTDFVRTVSPEDLEHAPAHGFEGGLHLTTPVRGRLDDHARDVTVTRDR